MRIIFLQLNCYCCTSQGSTRTMKLSPRLQPSSTSDWIVNEAMQFGVKMQFGVRSHSIELSGVGSISRMAIRPVFNTASDVSCS